MKCEFCISFKDETKLFCLTTPYRVLLYFHNAAKKEIKRMLDYFASVTEPSEWQAGIAVVPKNNQKVRLLFKYTNLNKNVMCEKNLLHAVGDVLAKLTDTKVFSKLQVKWGFW